MVGSLSVKTYVISVLFLAASIAIPFYYLTFIAPKSIDYDYTVAPKLQSIPKEDLLLKLDPSSYATITSGSRKHAAVVVLTALGSRFDCKPCLKLQERFSLVAQSFISKKLDYPLFFSYLDFEEGREIFLKWNVEHVPKILLFLPKKGNYAIPEGQEDVLDFMKSSPESLNEAAIADWISSATNQPFQYSTPLNMPLIFVVGVLGLISLLVIKWLFPVLSFFFANRVIWFLGSLTFVLLMTSGYMWNQIRHPPFASSDERGNPVFISPQYSQQFEAETYLVASLHFICALCTICLISAVPKLSPSLQRYSSFILLVILFVVYSRFLRVFLAKNTGYPYKLL